MMLLPHPFLVTPDQVAHLSAIVEYFGDDLATIQRDTDDDLCVYRCVVMGAMVREVHVRLDNDNRIIIEN